MSGGLAKYVRQSRTLTVSLVLVLPLLLAYEVGILLFQSPVENLAGLLVKRLIAIFGDHVLLVLTGLVAIAFVVALLAKQRRPEREFRLYGVMLLEAVGWALLLGPLIIAIESKMLCLASIGDVEQPMLRLILLMGAGAWEELVFRFALLGGFLWLTTGPMKGNRTLLTVVGVVLSSLVFALFHHIGALGDPLTLDRVLFRTLAGAALCVLYLLRGLGIGVYTHAFYNVGLFLTGQLGGILMKRVFVGMTGASGAIYTRALVRVLVAAGVEVAFCLSHSAAKVLRYEEEIVVDPGAPDLELLFGPAAAGVRFFPLEMVEAPVSSGSYATAAAVICPCSMGTLGSIAAGTSANLIERAADVMLKEGRPLLLVPRETPLSLIHLENMTRLARSGAVILPAAPGFYHHPKSIDDLVAHVVTKITDRLGLRLDLIERWGEE